MRIPRFVLLAALLIPACLTHGIALAQSDAEAPFVILITGANKGIGLEFARQYAGRGWKVIATCRNPQEAAELRALAKERSNVALERLDVTDHARIDELARQLRGTPIDVLLNNAGVTAGLQQETFGKLAFDQLTPAKSGMLVSYDGTNVPW